LCLWCYDAVTLNLFLQIVMSPCGCSQAYEDLKDMSHKVYLFNIYNLIQECYYQTTLPPPFSLLERLIVLVYNVLDGCKWRQRVGFNEDSFRE